MNIRLLILSFILFPVIACKKQEPSVSLVQNASIEEKYVDEQQGLNVRETPEKTGKKIATLPHGTKVLVLESKPESFTIDNRTGSWVKIMAGSAQGWAFGGFLAAKRPKDSCGPEFEAEKNCMERCLAAPYAGDSSGENTHQMHCGLDVCARQAAASMACSSGG